MSNIGPALSLRSESACGDDDALKQSWLHRQVRTRESARMDKPSTLLHEFIGECFGTFIMITFGLGVGASLSMQATQEVLYANMGGALGVTFGVLASFESSGGHLNPAVTVSSMIFSNMSAVRGIVYIVAQFVGAFLGAVVVTLNYVVFKGGDALTNFYCTKPYDGVSYTNAFFQEMLCAMLLLVGAMAITSGSPSVNKFHVAGFLGLLVFAIATCFGSQTGSAMNPARDLSPRLVWAMFYMWYGKGAGLQDLHGVVFMNNYWLVPIFAPLVGGPIGALLYKLAEHPVKRSEISPRDNASPALVESRV